MSNPLEWKIVEHQRYLVQALTPATAHHIHGWPFGNHLRCVKRVWSEQGLKNPHKQEWRNCSQTTAKQYNHRYTELWDAMPAGFPNTELLNENYEPIREETARPFWNKDDASVYYLFACWEEVMCKQNEDVVDNLATMTVRPFGLTFNSTPAELKAFLDKLDADGHVRLLSAQQIISLHRVEILGRRYNVNTWTDPIKWNLWGLPV